MKWINSMYVLGDQVEFISWAKNKLHHMPYVAQIHIIIMNNN